MSEVSTPVSSTASAATPAPKPASAPTPSFQIPSDPKAYLELLFDFMVKYDSSDIYLTYGEEPTIRVYGEARRIQGLPKLDDQMLDAFAQVMMSEEDKKNYEEHLAADLGISVK